MRQLLHLAQYRVKHPGNGSFGDMHNGMFIIPSPKRGITHGERLQVIASNGDGWDHVSCCVLDAEGLPFRNATWMEMQWLKEQFFEDTEAAFQLHPVKAEYKNLHPMVLHIWRPQAATIPVPPLYMV